MSKRKTLFVRSLKKESREGRRFTDLFLALRKSLATSSAGRPYLRLTLGDSTDTIDAFVWENAAELDRQFAEGDILEVSGTFKVYQGTPQIVVESLGKLYEEDLGSVDIGQFLPASKRPKKEMWEELRALLGAVHNPSLAGLFEAFCSDARFVEPFQSAPAATGFHHAYVSGLLEHTLGVVKLARALGPLYADRLNPEVLLAGAFLHDVGKVKELTVRTGFDYTDAGRLVGHIVLGVEMLRERVAALPAFPQPLLVQLEHLILSHHGEKEWGSPTQPQTLEALLLHYLDNIDAKLGGAWDWMEKERGAGNRWTTYWKGLGRQLFLPPLGGPEYGEGLREPAAADDLEEHFLRAEREAGAGAPPAAREHEKLRRATPGQGTLGF